MASMIEDQFTNLVLPGVMASFVKEMEQTPDVVSVLFNEQNSAGAYEKIVTTGGLGLMLPKVEGGAGAFDRMNQQYLTTFTHETFSKSVAISKELVEDQAFLTIATITQELGESAARSKQFYGAKVFNLAFATTTYGDGQFLCDTDHPYGTDDATNISNNGTTALSHSSLSEARVAMRKFVDPRGNPISAMGDILLVPPDLENTALEIVMSTQKSGTANNDANVLSNMRVIVWDYLTDINNWFLIDSRRAKRHLYWFNRIAPEITVEYKPTMGEFVVTASARWSYGSTDWRWIYGGEVA
jgi:phage major head subunit gpT-like protein